ncbi:MAG: TIM barrel protein [Candidatus Aenigmatarchaeota archaeon]
MAFKVYLGPGGTPISSLDRTTPAGIRQVAKLGLNALEVEFVRGVKMSPAMAKEVGELAASLGVRLSCHAPYFINLLSDKPSTVRASKQRILQTVDRAERMGADAVAVHAAYYGKRSREEAQAGMSDAVSDIVDGMKEMGTKVVLGLETMAKEATWGTLDEILELHKRWKCVVPYIDWCHIWVRNGGAIDYSEIFERLRKAGIRHINSHFSNSKYNANTKKWQDIHLPMGESKPDFGELAREIVKRKVDITIISESPVLEEDSLKMKKVFERLGYKFEIEK